MHSYQKVCVIIIKCLDIHIVCEIVGAQSLTYSLIYMGLDVRKPVFGVCKQQRLRPACSSIQTFVIHFF